MACAGDLNIEEEEEEEKKLQWREWQYSNMQYDI